MQKNIKKTFYIRTFGCQMNEHDSNKISLLLEEMGYKSVLLPEKADIILLNTCTIREKAHHKAISGLGRVKKYKKKNPDIIIGICGCVAEQDGTSLFKRIPYLDLVFGPDQISKLPEMIEKVFKQKQVSSLGFINNQDEYPFVDLIKDTKEQASAFVTAVKGCNCNCTYCIVPSVRGREVSRDPESIILEVNKLVKNKVKEITLLGQNVTSYKYKDTSLADLICQISNSTEIERIRFMSPHPKDITDELINEHAVNKKLCPYIHLPMQSGSNNMLKKMARGYTRESFIDIVKKLKQARPDISITSDFIVGFCGETDEDFNDTLTLIDEMQFDSIFAFRYSTRPGTLAAIHFADDVPLKIKENRLDILLEKQREITFNKNKSLVGQTVDILVTGEDRKKSGQLMGRMDNNRIVNFFGNKELIGSNVKILLTEGLANSMKGEIVL